MSPRTKPPVRDAAAHQVSSAASADTTPAWATRAIDRSPSVQVSRQRSYDQARAILDAARRLVETKGASFTTQELIKEAGVALQTFYRYFGSKDLLLLALIEDLISGAAVSLQRAATSIDDPVERLHFFVTSVVRTSRDERSVFLGGQFMAAERWRLQQVFPAELEAARRPFIDLISVEITAGTEAGQLSPQEPDHAARFVAELITVLYYELASASDRQSVDAMAESLWIFCLSALGGGPGADAGRSK
jgi:AcrR family transcriptional regulator